ncbi:hypothetical protein LZ189_12905 [Rhodovulum sulfidophilum]|nr:hypothetical protein [Rhodovulum sulfidophilum]
MREAGGLVGPIHEGRDPLEHGEVLVANEAIYDHFAKAVRNT